MSDELFASLTTIAIALVGLATLAVLVSNSANTGGVIKAASGGFAQDLAAAVSPVTSSGSLGSLNIGSFGNGSF